MYLDNINTSAINDQKLSAKVSNYVLEALTTKRLNRKRTAFYPSDALCSRKHWLEMHEEYEFEANPILTYSAAIGNATEFMLVKQLQELNSELVWAYDLPINSKIDGFDKMEWLDYSGKIDLILNVDNELIVCDVKTYGKNLRIEQYTAQLQFYAAVTGLEHAAILAFSRNLVENGRFAFQYIPISVTREDKINAVTVAYYAQLCYDYNLLPVKPKGFRKTVECKYCYFKQRCWNDELKFDYNVDFDTKTLEQAKSLATQFVDEPGKLERFILMVNEEKG